RLHIGHAGLCRELLLPHRVERPDGVEHPAVDVLVRGAATDLALFECALGLRIAGGVGHSRAEQRGRIAAEQQRQDDDDQAAGPATESELSATPTAAGTDTARIHACTFSE